MFWDEVISHFKVDHRFRARGYLDQVTEKRAWWHFHALGKGISSRRIGWSPHFRLNPCFLPELIPEAWLGPGHQSGNLPRSPARKARKLVPPAYRHLQFPASFLGKWFSHEEKWEKGPYLQKPSAPDFEIYWPNDWPTNQPTNRLKIEQSAFSDARQ